jgi:hypothetical protein
MRLTFPWSATSLTGANHSDFGHVVWLNAVMAVNTIVLYPKPWPSKKYQQPLDSEAEEQGPSESNIESDRNDSSRSWEFPHRGGDSMLPGMAPEIENRNTRTCHPQWQHCLATAQNMVSLIREVTRVTTEPLILNPNMAPLLFVCARVIITKCQLQSEAQRQDDIRSSKRQLRDDLAVLVSVFDRMTEVFDGIGRKSRGGVMYHLRLGPEVVPLLHNLGSRGFASTCRSWKEAGEDKSIPSLLL